MDLVIPITNKVIAMKVVAIEDDYIVIIPIILVTMCDTCYKLHSYLNYHRKIKTFAPSANHVANNKIPFGPSIMP